MLAIDVVPKITNEILERIESILQNKPIQDLDWRGN